MACLNDAVSLAEELCPPNNSELNRFTEVIVCETLVIPPQKPDKELITNVIKNFVVTDIEEITVDLGDNLVHKKVAVTGDILLGIEYSALTEEQEVHFAQFSIPFQGIVGYRPCVSDPADPAYNRGLNGAAFDIEDYNVFVCLEHEQYHQLSPREIKAVVVLLIWLQLKP